jgi:hypothetical protein
MNAARAPNSEYSHVPEIGVVAKAKCVMVVGSRHYQSTAAKGQTFVDCDAIVGAFRAQSKQTTKW